MFHGIAPFLLVSLNFLCAFTRGDTVVSCDLKESCILPCLFHASDEEVIHWIQEKTSASAHSYYYKQDQFTLQDGQFKGRTSLFLDQISKGNASLQLKEVGVRDEGRYKCYTSTIAGRDQTYVQLNVDAPVSKIDIHRTGNTITCSSEGIYPEPQLIWSTEPSIVSHQSHTAAQPSEQDLYKTEQELYNIRSSLNISSSDLNVSCIVKTRKNKRKTTLVKSSVQKSINGTKLSCTLPAPPRTNLVWRYNQSEEILRQDSNKRPDVSSKWEEYFVDLSASGMLTLKDLSAKESGRYTCEASNSDETLISDTLLRIDKIPETSSRSRATIAVVGVAAGILGLVFYIYSRAKNKGKKNVEDPKEAIELKTAGHDNEIQES